METATAAVERGEWQPGRNGGRLRTSGTGHGPRRETALVKKAIAGALHDPRGGADVEFFIKLKCGSAEDKRTFANITAKLLQIEVAAGDLGGELLKIVINTIVAAPNGEPMIVDQGRRALPRERTIDPQVCDESS